MSVKLILGDITFLDIQIDGEYKAIINRIDEVIECKDYDDAEIQGENALDNCESYLIPTHYGHEIVNNTKVQI